MASKYDRLTSYFRAINREQVTLTYVEIEGVLGDKLPESSRTHREWWANSRVGHSHSRGWLDAQMETGPVALGEHVTFSRRAANR